jgi:hypothetical protein
MKITTNYKRPVEAEYDFTLQIGTCAYYTTINNAGYRMDVWRVNVPSSRIAEKICDLITVNPLDEILFLYREGKITGA